MLFSDDVKCSSGTAANCAACGASCAGNDCKWDSGTSTCVVLGKFIDACACIKIYQIYNLLHLVSYIHDCYNTILVLGSCTSDSNCNTASGEYCHYGHCRKFIFRCKLISYPFFTKNDLSNLYVIYM